MRSASAFSLLVVSFILASSTSDAFQGVASTASRPPSSSTATYLSMMSPRGSNNNCEDDTVGDTRRQALGSILGFASTVALVALPTATQALDMDAFVNSQLESDTKNCDPKKDPKCLPKLSQDEALCKYGQSGEARAAACKRYKASGGALPVPGSQGKSLGGAYAM